MRKKVLILALLLSLVSCGENEEVSDNSIVGEWYSGEIGGSFYFDDDNNFSLRVDVRDTMYIDENNVAHIAGSDEDYSGDCHFDGRTYSFEVDGVDMLTMSREESSESAFGQYTLESGILYSMISSGDSGGSDRYSIIAGKDVFQAQIYMCKYSVSDNIVTFSGEDLSFFGAESGGVSIFDFAVENNVLTLVGEKETLVFSGVQ